MVKIIENQLALGKLATKTLAGVAPAAGDYAGMVNGDWCLGIGTGGIVYWMYEGAASAHWYLAFTALPS
jgi:hypothetical protein